MKIDEKQPREKMEILNLIGFILYSVIGIWSIVAFLATIVFTFSPKSEEVRSFFRIKANETSAYIIWTFLIAVLFMSIALIGRRMVNRTKQYII